MILSELNLDVRNPSALRAIADCNDMHRNLMRAFPGSYGNARKDLGILYRIMSSEGKTKVLVLSECEPKWENILHNGYTCSRTKNIEDITKAFEPDRAMGFDLMCAPTKKVKGDGKNSRRVRLTTPDERIEWLRRKGGQNGFQLLSCMECGETTVSGKRDGVAMSFTGINFKGNLRITDPGLFALAYRNGVGPEKAYGMGMLLLGRVI